VSHDPSERAQLWPVLRIELLSHERAEARAVYPELRERAETRAFVAQHDRDASELEEAVAVVDGLRLDAEAWRERFERVAELVKAHVEREEGEMFEAAQAVVGEAMAEVLDERFRIAKRAAMTEH
jgi:hemerythrin-like domain-containing protein